MIISQTPLRVSFFGGGTDLPSHYLEHGGSVLSTAVNKYCYITVNRRFDHTLRVSYSRTEIAETPDDINHPLVREALKMVGIDGGVEITSIADIPSGTGMGSSSTFTVGLLTALYAFVGRYVSAAELAARACEIEIHKAGEPIGKQDQYAAAFGGMNEIRFLADDSVEVDPIICPAGVKEALDANLMLFYTGIRRSASDILSAQQKAPAKGRAQQLSQLSDMVSEARGILMSGQNLNRFGALLHDGWQLKRGLSKLISSSDIDLAYSAAQKAGALGGKLLGAGGGGFLLLFCEPHNQQRVRDALSNMREIPIGFAARGSHVIFVSESI